MFHERGKLRLQMELIVNQLTLSRGGVYPGLPVRAQCNPQGPYEGETSGQPESGSQRDLKKLHFQL